MIIIKINHWRIFLTSPDESFYFRPTASVARDLVGKKLVRIVRGNDGQVVRRLSGVIVETEAYGHSDDKASHAYIGPTRRNSIMFGAVGRAYVYFSYGNHFCVNISARSPNAKAGAVLIRALQPLEGLDIMQQLRNRKDLYDLTSGPGKLTKAMGITNLLNGVDMTDPDGELHIEPEDAPRSVACSPRVGISRAVSKKWRFFDIDSPFVSRTVPVIHRARIVTARVYTNSHIH
jgi:DNA-3-methyladenine glycosylase